MKSVPKWSAILLTVVVVAAACSSESETPAETSTTVAPISTTETTQATTSSTTTTQPPVTADPDALLETVNEAMASQASFLAVGSLTMTDVDDGATEHVTAVLRGGQSSPDNSWIVSIMDVASGDFAGILQWEMREVGGVRYEQNPVNGDWKIDEDSDSNPVRDTLNGVLSLSGTSAEEIAGGYLISGTYPDDPTIELVELEVGADALLVSRLTTVTRDPRSEMAGFVPEGTSDIITTNLWNLGDYGIDIAPPFAPPDATATSITRFEGGMFQLQVPTEWGEASAEEIADAGLGVDRAWLSGDGIRLTVVTDDLVEIGIGTKTLEDYVDIIVSEVLADSVVDDTVMTVNVQGMDIAILRGSADDSGEVRFMRLIFVRDDTIAFNATIVGRVDDFETNRDAILFLLNSFLVNTP